MKPAPDPLLFVIVFLLFWLAVTLLLSVFSGWFGLAKRFPDHPEESPFLMLKGQSGSLGRVAMNRILTLSVCPAGLRIGVIRIFGPFSRSFLVPWHEIAVARSGRVLVKVARLALGRPPISTLVVHVRLADQLAGAAGARWPESRSFPEETGNRAP